MLTKYQQTENGHTTVLFAEPDRADAQNTMQHLASALDALTTYFDIDNPFPRVRAILAPNRDLFDTLVADLLGVAIERPSDSRRVAQAQKTDIVLLAPHGYTTESAYAYVADDYARMITHELVHVVQEHLCPDIENSPLWWDEGLAVYLSAQWQYDSQFRFREPVVEGIRQRQVPALADVEREPSFAYTYGWTLVRFIETRCGRREIARAVRETEDGDVLATLDEDRMHLGPTWSAWLLTGEALQT